MVIQTVDGKNLLTLYICNTENSSNLIISILELALIQKNLDVGVIDDSLLDNRRVYHVTQFLSHHTCNTVELSHGLIEVFDIFCHRR